MKYTVVVTPEALRDMARLEAFLSRHSERASARAVGVIRAGLRSLTTMPKHARTIAEPLHVLDIPFGQSGYSVWLRVENDAIIVARIFHMREDR